MKHFKILAIVVGFVWFTYNIIDSVRILGVTVRGFAARFWYR